MFAFFLIDLTSSLYILCKQLHHVDKRCYVKKVYYYYFTKIYFQ